MLITDEIQKLCDTRKLFPVDIFDWKRRPARQVHVSPDIHRFLVVRSKDRATNNDSRRLQGFFESFIVGEILSVTLEPDIMETDMKRLSPGAKEVWEIKIGEKFRHWRVFGRFAGHNHFIALTGPTDRAGIDPDVEILRCQEEWWKLLDGSPPLYGSTINDYISPSGFFVGSP